MTAAETAVDDRIVSGDTLPGFVYAATAYSLWAALPLYLKMLADIPLMELVAHRVIWSVPIAAGLLLLQGRLRRSLGMLLQPRKLGLVAVNATFITINSLTYIYAIVTDQALESAIGYYINPLMSILIAAALLGEKIDGLKLISIGFAACAVIILAWSENGLPWISIVIALSWGFYAYFKKSLPLQPSEGFFLEMVVLSAPSLAYLCWLQNIGQGHFLLPGGERETWLLMLSGLTAAAPLTAYAYGAKLLRLSTIAIMQYIGPTITFFLAIFIFHEKFGSAKLAAFALIWIGVVFYALSIIKDVKRHRAQSTIPDPVH